MHATPHPFKSSYTRIGPTWCDRRVRIHLMRAKLVKVLLRTRLAPHHCCCIRLDSLPVTLDGTIKSSLIPVWALSKSGSTVRHSTTWTASERTSSSVRALSLQYLNSSLPSLSRDRYKPTIKISKKWPATSLSVRASFSSIVCLHPRTILNQPRPLLRPLPVTTTKSMATVTSVSSWRRSSCWRSASMTPRRWACSHPSHTQYQMSLFTTVSLVFCSDKFRIPLYWSQLVH